MVSTGATTSEPDATTVLEKLPLYGFDIETDTSVDGLDPTRSPVVAVALWGGPLGLHDGSPGHVSFVLDGEAADEPTLLVELDRTLLELPAGVLVTWNGRHFDLPFIAERARRLGLEIGLRIDPVSGEAAWHHHRHLDGLRAYRADVGRTVGISCALKPLSRLVGEEPVEVDRTQVHRLAIDLLQAYVVSDARLAQLLVSRRWPTIAGWTDRVPSTGPVSGSTSPPVRDTSVTPA